MYKIEHSKMAIILALLTTFITGGTMPWLNRNSIKITRVAPKSTSGSITRIGAYITKSKVVR
jgi:hypothetical protein